MIKITDMKAITRVRKELDELMTELQYVNEKKKAGWNEYLGENINRMIYKIEIEILKCEREIKKLYESDIKKKRI